MYLSDVATGNLYSLNMNPIRHLNFTTVEKKVSKKLEKFERDLKRIFPHFHLTLKYFLLFQKISIKSPLTYSGTLLGPPKGLAIHPNGVLFYILPRDGAIVMWDPQTPLMAEFHEVVYQNSYNLTQLLFGHKGNIYAISENVVRLTLDGRQKHCIKIPLE